MKQTKLQGFTLMEVLISFILISFIAIMVCSSMSSGFALSVKLYELPNAYYEAEDKVEKKMDELSEKVKKYYRLRNEVLNTPSSQLDPAVDAELASLSSELSAVPKETVNLFGKSVEIYKIEVDHTALKLHAGVVNAEELERPVPIIDTVSIKPQGGSVVSDLYFAAARGTVLEASVTYDNKNSSYHFRDLYQWYIGTGGFHVAEYSDGLHLENEARSGTVYSTYPTYYTLLTGETKSSIQIKEEYLGQLLVCVVTPLSKNGAMGESKVSNPLYVSALPEISSGKYRMFIDVSAQPFAYTTNATTDSITEITNRGLDTVQGRFVASGSAKPVVNLDGAATDTSISSAPSIKGTYTRYISFTSSTYMTSNNFWNNIINPHAFVVVKNNNSSDVDFITVTDDQNRSINIKGGLITNIRKTDGHGDSGWQVIEVKLNGDDNKNLLKGVITLGKTKVDVAEFIVVGNAEATREECDKIWNYLLQKYRIVE